MQNLTPALRRWLAMFCLGIAAGLLIWGRTFLLPLLRGGVFLLYWTACATFAALAISFGLTDIRCTLRTLREEHRARVRETFEKIRHGSVEDDES